MKVACLLLSFSLVGACLGYGEEPAAPSGSHEPAYDGKPLGYWVTQSKDKDRAVREAAADALGEIGPAAKAAVPALVELLKDKERQVPFVAAVALGKIGPAAKGATPALMEMLKGKDKIARSAAAWALWNIGDPKAKEEALRTLADLLKDKEGEVSSIAAAALKKIRREAKTAARPLDEKTVKGGFDSPAAAFHAYITGKVTQDFDSMLSALTRESQAYHIGLAVFALTYLYQEDEYKKILREHGLSTMSTANRPDKEKERDGAAREQEATEDADETQYIDAMLSIKNPEKLMKKVSEREGEIARRLAKDKVAPPSTKEPTKKEIIESIVLKDIEITEDAATGCVELREPAKSLNGAWQKKDVRFRKIQNRWYCDIDPR